MNSSQARTLRPALLIAVGLTLVASGVPATTTTTTTTTTTNPPNHPTTTTTTPATGTPTGALPPNHPTAPPVNSAPTPMPKIPPLPATPATSADLTKARKVKQVTLVVHHRVFHDFSEDVTARMNEPFTIGDTDYEAVIDRYVPDFAMDITTMRVVSRTDQTNNPAFRIIVREKGAVQDTTWALLNSPPHFARKSMLAFQAVRIDFASGKPLQSTVAVAPGGKAK
jgi:hypothetical protein